MDEAKIVMFITSKKIHLSNSTAGFCGIDWSQSTVTSPDPFQVAVDTGVTAIGENTCANAFLEIPGSTPTDDGTQTKGSNIFCGDHLKHLVTGNNFKCC